MPSDAVKIQADLKLYEFAVLINPISTATEATISVALFKPSARNAADPLMNAMINFKQDKTR